MHERNEVMDFTESLAVLIIVCTIGFLYIISNASAIELQVSSPPEADENTNVNMIASIELETGEALYISNISILIGSDECIFKPDGLPIDCNDFAVSAVNISKLGYYDNQWAYGFNGIGYSNESYYGGNYGYGYSGTDLLAYNITWKAPLIDYDKKYWITLKASATDGSKKSAFYSQPIGIWVRESSNTFVIDKSDSIIDLHPGYRTEKIVVDNAENVRLNLSELATTFARIEGEILIDSRQQKEVMMQLPANLGLSKSGWDYLLLLLDETSYSIPISENKKTQIVQAVDTGSSISVDRPVRISFVGQSNKKNLAGFDNGIFQKIETKCPTDDYDQVNQKLDANSDCYIDTGTDYVIWTRHLDTFIVYREVQITSIVSSSGGGGGGGGDSYTQDCTSSWECTKWPHDCAPNGKLLRVCIDKHKCRIPTSIPETMRPCDYVAEEIIEKEAEIEKPAEQRQVLFDIGLEILDKTDETMIVKVNLLNFGVPGRVDAHIHYEILDEYGTVFEEFQIVPVETQLEFIKEFNLSGLGNGNYRLQADLTYAGQVEPASALIEFSKTQKIQWKFWPFILVAIAGGLVIGWKRIEPSLALYAEVHGTKLIVRVIMSRIRDIELLRVHYNITDRQKQSVHSSVEVLHSSEPIARQLDISSMIPGVYTLHVELNANGWKTPMRQESVFRIMRD